MFKKEAIIFSFLIIIFNNISAQSIKKNQAFLNEILLEYNKLTFIQLDLTRELQTATDSIGSVEITDKYKQQSRNVINNIKAIKSKGSQDKLKADVLSFSKVIMSYFESDYFIMSDLKGREDVSKISYMKIVRMEQMLNRSDSLQVSSDSVFNAFAKANNMTIQKSDKRNEGVKVYRETYRILIPIYKLVLTQNIFLENIMIGMKNRDMEVVKVNSDTLFKTLPNAITELKSLPHSDEVKDFLSNSIKLLESLKILNEVAYQNMLKSYYKTPDSDGSMDIYKTNLGPLSNSYSKAAAKYATAQKELFQYISNI